MRIDYSHDYASNPGNWTSTTTTEWSNNGSYENTAKGRQQSGTETVTSDTTSSNSYVSLGVDEIGRGWLDWRTDAQQTTHISKTTEYSNTQSTITSESRTTGTRTSKDLIKDLQSGNYLLGPRTETESYVIENGVFVSPNPPASSQGGEEEDGGGNEPASGPRTSTGGGVEPKPVAVNVGSVSAPKDEVPTYTPSVPEALKEEPKLRAGLSLRTGSDQGCAVTY